MVDIVLGGSLCDPDATPAAGNTIGYLNTVADLRAETDIFTVPVTVLLAGNQSPNDGFGGLFTFDPASVAPDNGYSIIQQTSNDGAGRWIINPEAAPAPDSPVPRNIADVQGDTVNVFSWGAVGDGLSRVLGSVTEFGGQNTTAWSLAQWQASLPAAVALTDELDWAAWQSALNYAATLNAPVVAPRGTFMVNKPLVRPGGVSIHMSAATTIRANAVMAVMITSSVSALERNAFVVGGTLDCNFLANGGIELNCATACTLQDILVSGALINAFKIGDSTAAVPSTENHVVRCKSTWLTTPSGQQPAPTSVGLMLYGCTDGYITDCVFSNHHGGIQLNLSTDNQFRGVRVYNVVALSEMVCGFLVQNQSSNNHWTDCIASECITYGWNLNSEYQFLINCQVNKTYGTPNNLIGIFDQLGNQAITSLSVIGTVGVPIQQDISFASDAVKATDYIAGVIDLNVNTQYTSPGSANTGDFVAHWGSTAPNGTYVCDGSAKSRITDAALFGVINTIYGAGDGATTFNIPNAQGYFLRGLNTTGTGPDAGRALGTVQSDEVGPHDHTVFGGNLRIGNGQTGSTGGFNSTAGTAPGGTVIAADATTTSETRPANLALLICIKR